MENFDSDVSVDFIKAGPLSTARILKIEPRAEIDFLVWLERNRVSLEAQLIKYGGILFRNFSINSLSEFNQIANHLCPKLVDYTYRSTPRTKLGGKIYTATEYPNDRTIPFHNENAYSREWPAKILFYSAVVAQEGGQTPIADSRHVYKKLDPTIRKKFEEKGVLYVRNYIPGVDLSWQEVFQTQDKEEVMQYCRDHHIEFEWLKGPVALRTKQVCQGTILHPITQEAVWFNQAHLFHASAISAEERLTLTEAFGKENLPRHALYGDGEEIDEEALMHIKQIYEEEKIEFAWQKGDFMYLDNVLMAHGRAPYVGARKVVVAMGG